MSIIRSSSGLLLVAALASGCGGGGGGETPAGCDFPRHQLVSQPCCTEHGVDACGAMLVCAAFDGRTQASCYPERSQPDGAECGEDRHCQSGSCNPAERKCRALPGTACTESVGCAIDPTGKRHACVVEAQGATCKPVGNGGYGTVCAAKEDCAGAMLCEGGRCGFGTCVPPDYTSSGACDRVDPDENYRCSDCLSRLLYDCEMECEDEVAAVWECAAEVDCELLSCRLVNCGAQWCELFECCSYVCF